MALALRDPLIEPVLALQESIKPSQEASRLRSLDDAVVVGARDRHDLGPRDIADRARGDDRALAFHQARHGGDGADRPRVRQRDRAAGEIIGEELVGACLLDQRLVRLVERGEVHPLGVLDDRHHEPAAAVLALDVDGEAQPDALRCRTVRFAVDFLKRMGHHRELFDGLDDREGNQVRE